MELGMIGLGRMGGNMAQRLISGGHRVVTYDRDPDAVTASHGFGGEGHFTKMVHNGIEYGMMQSYAEGFELMAAKEEFALDLPAIAEVWRHGSVVRSWLLDLAAIALAEDPKLEGLQAYVDDSGEGRWTVQESLDLAIPAPVITLSLQQRFRSRQDQPFGVKLLAALRNQFGGHAVRPVQSESEGSSD